MCSIVSEMDARRIRICFSGRREIRIHTVGNLVHSLADEEEGGDVGKVVALEVQVLPHGHDSGVLPAVRYVSVGIRARKQREECL